MNRVLFKAYMALLLLVTVHEASGEQLVNPTPVPQSSGEIQQRIDSLSESLMIAQQRLQESQRELGQMQEEIQKLRQQISMQPTAAPGTLTSAPAPPPTNSSSSTLIEDQQALEAAVKLHDQIKVESASKYPLRVTGLVLFNAFLNKGLGDNIDVPAVALRETATSGNGSLGGSFRQTVLGLEGDGPVIAGARSSASIDFDFFSGVSYTDYGTSAGIVRMRTANIALNWERDRLEVGLSPPLISPLSPTSFATISEPALSGAGNLWTWAPQLRYAHDFGSPRTPHVQLELGLWDSPSAGYNPNQLFRIATPGELSEQPAYETRFSYTDGQDLGLQLGMSGYYSRQSYPGYAGSAETEHLDSWATTFDWRIPVSRYFEFSGEGYRGRALGGLGGGVYKDVITGTSRSAGLPMLQGLNASGGWVQWKSHFKQSLESNLSIGLDDGFARDFHAVLQSPTASATQLRARNRMSVANVIFRPKASFIISPEYRRIWSWPITGTRSTLNIFTLSVGYRF